jgi:hypothetical protein
MAVEKGRLRGHGQTTCSQDTSETGLTGSASTRSAIKSLTRATVSSLESFIAVTLAMVVVISLLAGASLTALLFVCITMIGLISIPFALSGYLINTFHWLKSYLSRINIPARGLEK